MANELIQYDVMFIAHWHETGTKRFKIQIYNSPYSQSLFERETTNQLCIFFKQE